MRMSSSLSFHRHENLVFLKEISFGFLFFSHLKAEIVCWCDWKTCEKGATLTKHPSSSSYPQSFLKLHPCSLHDSHRHNKHGMHKRHAILLFVLSPLHLLRARR